MNHRSRAVKVFLTVDTEVWPKSPDWPHTPLVADYDFANDLNLYFYGGGGASARGVPWQLHILATCGLKATYFIEPLFSFAVGISPLRDVVAMIRDKKQEVGLHLHPEWLNEASRAALPPFSGPLLHEYA